MKKSQIEINKVYAAKISGRIAPIKIISESPYGGWNGLNMKTNRPVRIKMAGKLRYKLAEEQASRLSEGWY